MAKPSPNVSFDDGEHQQIRDETEIKAYGDTGGLATDEEIARRHLQAFDRPRVSALIGDVLTGRWGLGTTMVSVADKILTDHTAISRGFHWGEMSPALQGRLMACRGRPKDLQAVLDKVRDAQFRKGFMAVAEYLGGRLMDGSWPRQKCLLECHAELMFELLERKEEWKSIRENTDFGAAQRIVRDVLDSANRELVPFWYTKALRRQANLLLNRLQSDSRFAFTYLCLLHRRWNGVFVLTHAAIEDIEWA